MKNSDQFQCKFPGLDLFCHQDSVQKWQTPHSFAAFCGSGVPQCQLSSREMLLFPILRRKAVSLNAFYELIEGLPLSAAATGKSHSQSEVPVVRGRGCQSGILSKLRFHHNNSLRPVNSADPASVLTPLVSAGNLSLIAKPFILNFNKWETHSSLMPQAFFFTSLSFFRIA